MKVINSRGYHFGIHEEEPMGKRYLSHFFACCSLLAMLAAVGLRIVQVHDVREDDSSTATLESETKPLIHLFNHDHRIEWSEEAAESGKSGKNTQVELD